MAIILDDFPIFVIMLSVRWYSDAFLGYIIKQVMNFNKGV